MAKVPNGIETLPKISITWVGCTNVTDDRRQTTDRRTDDDIANMNMSSRSLKWRRRRWWCGYHGVHCQPCSSITTGTWRRQFLLIADSFSTTSKASVQTAEETDRWKILWSMTAKTSTMYWSFLDSSSPSDRSDVDGIKRASGSWIPGSWSAQY